jgi:CoA:oxalate CoA-transferase
MATDLKHGAVPADHDDEPAFAGITILDLSQGIAGPYCTLLLGQQGARVIKVEPPAGDWGRQLGRALGGHSAISIAANVGKESVVLDARTPAGKAALRKLAAKADVVIQNFRPGVADRMGVGYEELSRENPRLVYVSISGYGSDGPYANLPALDSTVQAVSGLMHTNRDATGRPRRIGLIAVDLSTAIYASQATAAALYRCARTGRGRHVEMSMLECCAALQSYVIIDDAMFPGQEHTAFNAPTGLFDAKDGTIYVSMVNDAMFGRLAQVLGFDDWLADDGLRTSAGRIPRAAELTARFAQAVAQRTIADWEEVFTRNDILFGTVARASDLPRHPQAVHAGLFSKIVQTGIGDLPWPALPGQPGHAPATAGAPVLGEHTEAVLREFGIDVPARPG